MTLVIFAHPPVKITVEFASETPELTVQIHHKVDNPKTHFIESLTIFLNEEKIITQHFSEQLSKEVQQGIFFIPSLKENDVISIEAKCNKGGDFKKTVTFEKTEE